MSFVESVARSASAIAATSPCSMASRTGEVDETDFSALAVEAQGVLFGLGADA